MGIFRFLRANEFKIKLVLSQICLTIQYILNQIPFMNPTVQAIENTLKVEILFIISLVITIGLGE